MVTMITGVYIGEALNPIYMCWQNSVNSDKVRAHIKENLLVKNISRNMFISTQIPITDILM